MNEEIKRISSLQDIEISKHLLKVNYLTSSINELVLDSHFAPTCFLINISNRIGHTLHEKIVLKLPFPRKEI